MSDRRPVVITRRRIYRVLSGRIERCNGSGYEPEDESPRGYMGACPVCEFRFKLVQTQEGSYLPQHGFAVDWRAAT